MSRDSSSAYATMTHHRDNAQPERSGSESESIMTAAGRDNRESAILSFTSPPKKRSHSSDVAGKDEKGQKRVIYSNSRFFYTYLTSHVNCRAKQIVIKAH